MMSAALSSLSTAIAALQSRVRSLGKRNDKLSVERNLSSTLAAALQREVDRLTRENRQWWQLVEEIDATVAIDDFDARLAGRVHQALWPDSPTGARK